MSIYRRRLMIANALKKSDSNINYPGLIAAWSAKGKSNDDADRAVLRDLTGNGHDITLNNFAFSKMSGYGGYNVPNLSSWNIQASTGAGNVKKISLNKLQIKIVSGALLWSLMSAGSTFKIRCSEPNAQLAGENCIYTKISEDTYSVECTKGDRGGLSILNPNDFFNKTIEFELLPEYPDALVFDGVDDYGINEEMPIQTDYTVIVKREIFSGSEYSHVIGKRTGSSVSGAFWFERGKGDTWSFGMANSINILNESISWQSATSYNGTPIEKDKYEDVHELTIGVASKTFGYFISMAFYSAYLFDRSLDEQEIKAFIRKYIDADYLLPSEIPTPDCYYDFTNGDNASETRDTIVDLSGNGNDAKAYNFAWNEEGSGYKDGSLQFDGTDDYISLEAFDSGFQTILMLCNYSTLRILYDQRNNEHQFQDAARFVIYAQEYNVAYNWGNVGGVTYINGKLNSSVLANETILKKHCICINNPTVTSEFTTIPKIGGPSTTTSKSYAKMSVFKFLGFKEALTEEQIQYVIKKYNLLDGVDEIEVS